ncbi:Internal alternative NAD(P)H-ubiquinone oxidoreductase A1 [Coccomyxa sp. Obi]|nr:Internal alternative NAD(P)H-ubiquinone oxidoreductase A1 [Coccomyxa sp. Obi]
MVLSCNSPLKRPLKYQDVLLHARRAVQAPQSANLRLEPKQGSQGSTSAAVSLHSSKPIVLVLGSGWAAHSFIKVIDTEMCDVVVVSPRNHFIFTPMLPSSAVGTVEYRSLLEPVRISNPHVSYIEASCEVVDMEKKVALCTASVAYESGQKPEFEVSWDLLIMAVGEQTATFGVPGVEEHCFFMKASLTTFACHRSSFLELEIQSVTAEVEITDSVKLRRRIVECFELATLPGASETQKRKAVHFVVVGGGPTGVEFAGALEDFLRGDLARKPGYRDITPYVQVTLLQHAHSVLTMFTEELQERALATLRQGGVHVRLGVRVVAVTQDQVILGVLQVILEGGEHIAYGACVWTTGNAAVPLVQAVARQLPQQQDLAKGRNPAATKLAVDPFLRIAGARDALALGDCSRLTGAPLPSTAQNAPDSESTYLEERSQVLMLLAQEGGKVEYYGKPFEFLPLGFMAYLGRDKAVTHLEAGKLKFDTAGYLSFLIWRSVYLTKQVSTRNRVLIFWDWIKTRAFGRDLSNF